MAQLNDLIVNGSARFLNTIHGNIDGNSSNVTGTVVVANGGTGATTAQNARANLSVPYMYTDSYPTLQYYNGTNTWIKIGTSNTSYGLLPSAAGNAGSGHNYLGTSTWYWKYSYIDEMNAVKLNGVTIGSSPKFTDTTYSMTRDGASVKLTPSSGTAQTVGLSDLINGLTEGSSPAEQNDYLVAQYAGGGTTTTSYHRRAVKNIVNSSNVMSALGGDSSTTTQCLTKKGTWATFGTSNLTLGTSATTALKGDTKYAGSSSAGGAATSANKINTDGGSMLNPVYFSSGVPVASSGNTIPFIVGTGSTAGTWLGSLTGLTAYYDGLLILYKPSVAGAATTTLNINSLGAKTCYINNTTKLTTHFPANQPILLAYSTSQNSGCWMCIDDYWTNSNTIPSAYCGTAAATAAKTASCDYYVATAKTYTHIDIRYANTSASAITLNINSQGAKPIYINGTASSASNYTLPAGTYLIYYDGTNYYFRTDGKLTASITGDAGTVGGHTVAKDVPSNAVFTDTNNAVTQTATSDNKSYRILFSGTNDDTTRTEGARKASTLKYNPSSDYLYAGNLSTTANIFATGSINTQSNISMQNSDNNRRALLWVGGNDDGVLTLYNSSGTDSINIAGHGGKITCAELSSSNDSITVSKMMATAFNSAIAVGSYEAQSTTVPNLVNELRYSNGCCGSVSITTAYAGNPDTIATGWYNFLWIPHRSGGKNGAANGDNTNYGRLLLFGMTVNNEYAIRYSGSSITYCRRFLMANGVNYATLYSGSLTTGNQTSVANGYGTYTGYLVIGTLTGTDVRSCVYVPKANLTTSAIRYQYADESDYRSFQMWYSSSTLYIKSDAGSNASGAVKYVYGIQ